MALCEKCHLVKHFGMAGILASEGKINLEDLIKHFMKVNSCDRRTFEEHKYEWLIDISVLKSYNIEKQGKEDFNSD